MSDSTSRVIARNTSLPPRFRRLHDESLRLALTLFEGAVSAAEVAEHLISDAVSLFPDGEHFAAAEVWIYRQLVEHAELEWREAELQRRRRRRPTQVAVLPEPLREAHARGALMPLVRKLPVVLATAFRLQFFEWATLKEMMRRTGASAGILTHRVREAQARLEALLHQQREQRDTSREGSQTPCAG